MGNAQRDAFISAAKNGLVDELRDLLSKLSREDKRAGRYYDDAGEKGQSALHKAAELGWLPCVQLLVDAGAQKHRLDESGRSPLFLAVDAGRLEVVDYLLKNGSDPNYTFCAINADKRRADAEVRRETPLLRAAAKGNLDMVIMLCKSGADVNVRVTDGALFFGTTALMLAASSNRLEVARYLLVKADAKVDVVNNDGSSALHIAAYAGYDDIVSLLVHRGADAEMRNGFRETPNDLARRGNCNSVAKFLSSLTPNVRAEMAAKLAAEKQLEARRRAEVEQNAPLKPARKPKVVEQAAPATASGDGGDAQVGEGRGGLLDAFQKSMSVGIAMLPSLGSRPHSDADGDCDGTETDAEKDKDKPVSKASGNRRTTMVSRLPAIMLGSAAPSRAQSPRSSLSVANSGTTTPLHGSGGSGGGSGGAIPLLQQVASILTTSKIGRDVSSDDGEKTKSAASAEAADDETPQIQPVTAPRQQSTFDLFDSTAAAALSKQIGSGKPAVDDTAPRSRANSASKRGVTAEFVVEGLQSPTGGKASATAAKMDALKTMLSQDGKKHAPAGGNVNSVRATGTDKPTSKSAQLAIANGKQGEALPAAPRSGTATPTEQESAVDRRARPSVTAAAVGLPPLGKK